MPNGSNAECYQLLLKDRRFQDLLLPYISPYFVYVAVSSIPTTVATAEALQAIKLLATGAVLLWFSKQYRFGRLTPVHGMAAFAGLPVALLCWIGPIYLLAALGVGDVTGPVTTGTHSTLYFYLRLVNSVFLVAIFEELFIRVYVMGWLFQAGTLKAKKGLVGSVLDTLEHHPKCLSVLPLSLFSVVGAAIVFMAGHQWHEYLSAVLYFLFTTWLYKKTGSLWVCILIHGLTNLSIGLLVHYAGMGWLW